MHMIKEKQLLVPEGAQEGETMAITIILDAGHGGRQLRR